VEGQRSKVKGQKKNSKAKSLIFAIGIVCTMLLSSLTVSYADVFTSKDLINDAKKWNGQNVVYRGEAVTAIMKHDGYSWVNVSDGDNAIGVWCNVKLLKKVRFLGNYKNAGDILEVEGRFHQACPMHDGDLDIHAYHITIVKEGHVVHEKIDNRMGKVSIALFLLMIASVLIFKKRT
jgi:hypothetical protein